MLLSSWFACLPACLSLRIQGQSTSLGTGLSWNFGSVGITVSEHRGVEKAGGAGSRRLVQGSGGRGEGQMGVTS